MNVLGMAARVDVPFVLLQSLTPASSACIQQMKDGAQRLAVAVVVVALMSLAPLGCQGYAVVNEVGAIRYYDGESLAVSDVTTECQPSDTGSTLTFQNVGEDGVVQTVTQQCGEDTYLMTLSPYAYVPLDGMIFNSDVFVSANPSTFITGTTAGPLYPPSPVTGRQLQGVPDFDCPDGAAGRHCTRTGNFAYPNVAVLDRVVHGGVSERVLQASNCMSPTYTGGEYYTGPFGDNDGGSYSSYQCTNPFPAGVLQVLASNFSTANATLYAFAAAETQLNDARLRLDENFNATIFEALAFSNSTQQVIATEQKQLDLELSTQTAVENELRRGLTNHSAELAANYRILANLSDAAVAFGQQSENAFEQQYAATVNNTAAGIAAYVRLDAQRVSNAVYVNTNLRFMEKMLIGFYTLLQRRELDEDMNDAQTEQINSGFANPVPLRSGQMPEPFLEFRGVPPAVDENDLGPDLSTLIKSNPTIRRAVVMNGTLYGVESNVNLTCWSLAIVNSQTFQPTWRDIQRIIGGIRGGGLPCIPDYTLFTLPQERCICYYVADQHRCPLQPSDAETWTLAAFDDPMRDALCLSSPERFEGGYNNTKLLKHREYAEFLASLAVLPNYGGLTYAAVNPLAGMSNNEIVYSPLVADPDNFMALMQAGANSDASTLVYALNQMDELAWANAYRNQAYYRIGIKGLPPNYMDQDETFFKRLAEGDAMRGTRFSTMLFGNSSLLVSLVTSAGRSTSTSVSVNGVVTSLRDVTTTNPYDGLVPVTDVKIWDPSAADQFVINSADEDVPLDANWPSRKHAMTYNEVAEESQFTRDQLQYIYGIEYVHGYGVNVPYSKLQPLDTNPASLSYGQCLTEDLAASGQWCDRRRAYEFRITGNAYDSNTPAQLAMVSRHTYVRTTFELRRGKTVLNVVRECPSSVRYAHAADTVIVQYSYTNPDSADAILEFQLSEVGACAFAPETIRIASGGSLVKIVETCAAARGASTPDYLVTSYDGGPTAGTINCPVTVPLDFQLTKPQAFAGAASVGLVRTLTVYAADTVLIGLQSANDRITQSLFVASDADLLGEYDLNFKVQDSAAAAYDDLKNNLEADREDAIQLAAEAREAMYNPDVDIGPFQAKFSALTAQLQAEFEQTEADAAAFAKLVQEQDDDIQVVVEFSQGDNADFGDALMQVTGFFGGFLTMLNATVYPPDAPPLDYEDYFDRTTDAIKRHGEAAGSAALKAGIDIAWNNPKKEVNALGIGLGNISIGGIVGAILILVGVLLAIYLGVKAFKNFARGYSPAELALVSQMARGWDIPPPATNGKGSGGGYQRVALKP